MYKFDDFWLDGESACSLGIRLQKEITFSAPSPRVESISIPGRSGNLLIPDGSFENVVGTAECFCTDKNVTAVMTAVNAWLMRSVEYRRLETLNEPDFYRLARLTRGAELEPRLNHLNPFTLEFDCKPQKYYKSGEWPLEYTAKNKKLYSPSPFPALPLITITGTGNGTITINGVVITMSECNGVTLDCESKEATVNGASVNSRISGTYPTLGEENTITWSGGITALEIVPRWWTL